MKKRQFNIKQRMMLIVLATSLSTILLLTGIALYEMACIRSAALKNGMEIGQEAMQSSSNALLDQKKIELHNLVVDRVSDMNANLEQIRREVRGLSNEMTNITSHPEQYAERIVLPPNPNNRDILVSQLLFSQMAAEHKEELQSEIRIAANISRISCEIMRDNKVMVTAFAASEKGYTILTDRYSDLQKAYFDSRTRPWYQLAKERRELVFSKVERDPLNGELCIFCAMPYYKGNTFAGVVATGTYITDFKKIVESISDYHGQFAFVLDSDGRIILRSGEPMNSDAFFHVWDETMEAADENLTEKQRKLQEISKKMTAGETGVIEAEFADKAYMIAYAPVEGMDWSCAAVIPKEEVIAPSVRNNNMIKEMTQKNIEELNHQMDEMKQMMLLCVVCLLGSVIYIGRKLAEHFVQPIQILSDSVREVASGNLDKKIIIQSGDEIEHLASCFNAMTDELKVYMSNLAEITAKEERIATELSIATRIQENMLPNIFPAFPDHQEFDIYATMQPAKEIGGDFYDFYLLDDKRVAITIADVSGKGIPAALFMVTSKAVMKNAVLGLKEGEELSKALVHANEQLCQNNQVMMFVTAFLGVLDLENGGFSYVSAGHNPPLLYRSKEKQFDWLPTKQNFVMGAMEGTEYHGQQIKLHAGDVLYLYTDGVTEAGNEKELLYGEERLMSCLNNASGRGEKLQGLLGAVRQSLDEFVGAAEQSDDITMLAVLYKNDKEAQQKEMEMQHSDDVWKLQIESTIENLALVQEFLGDLLAKMNASPKEEMQLQLAVEEIYVNIVHYAYGNTVGTVTIFAETQEDAGGIVLRIEDEGIPYNPLLHEDPDVSLPMEERKIGNLGIFLAKNCVDAIEYEHREKKNVLMIRKNIMPKVV